VLGANYTSHLLQELLNTQFGGYDEARAIRAEHDVLLSRIRERFPEFLKASDPLPGAMDALKPGERLVYFASTIAGSLSILAGGREYEVEAWWDIQLTSEIISQMLRRTEGTDKRVVGGLLAAQEEGVEKVSSALRRATAQLGVADGVVAQLASSCYAQHVERLIVIPCGLLGLLPLHAALIPGATAEDASAPLQDSLRISYAPSARVWLTARQHARVPHGPLEALIVGNPLPLPAGTPALKGAEAEARRIGALAENETAGRTWVLLAEAATRSAVLEILRGSGSTLTHAHFACHGLADTAKPDQSALVLAGGARLLVRDLLDPAQGIRFEQLRLAALSACQSGMPGMVVPDEVVGLPAGWLQAGAAAVLASLWPVDDDGTSALMQRFYELHLVDGVDPVDALWLAQRWLRGLTSWRDDFRAMGAVRSADGAEASEVVRGLALARRANGAQIGPDEEDDEDTADTMRASGVAASAYVAKTYEPSWRRPRVWAAFAVYGS
jgi:CHAT domain-containing protein